MKGTEQPLGAQDLGGVLDAMREGIQVVDRDFRYAYLNAAAAAHGRRPREELIGRTMSECYPGIEGTELFSLLRRCMETREPSALQNEFVYPDGKHRVFELRIEPCEAGIVVMSIDVTDGR